MFCLKERSRESKARNRILLTALCGLCAGRALAQGAESPPAPASSSEATSAIGRAADEPLEELVVTGSRIRGAAPVGSSIVALDTKDIAASGATTTTDLIQQVPQVFNLGVSESSRGQSGGSSNITYGSAINLRGIGPYTTLTIVDGHRVVPQGTTGFAVDPSVIPTLGLERVEIVADGASAIYGSDAIAGVVNLILRRDFEGVEVNARYGTADDYWERQLGVVMGHKWSSGQFTASLENGYHSALNGTDRDFYRGDLTAAGGSDYRVTTCNPGNIVVGGVSYAIPAGGVTPANAAALAAGTSNKCDTAKIADLLPRQNHLSGSFTFNQQLGDLVRVFADGFASRRDFRNYVGAVGSTLAVPNTNAFFVAPPGTAPATESVAYSFGNDYPQSYTDGYSKSFNVHGGFDVKLPFQWKFEGDYGYGWDRDLSTSHNVAFAPALTAALASGNPATALNPFGGANSAAVINSILVGASQAPGRSVFQTYEAKIDGPIVALPAGEIRGAVGYEGQALRVRQDNVNGTVFAPVDTARFFSRRVNSGYAELLIPFFSDQNGLPGLRKLDIDAAVRYDSYSDVGHTTNPKVGVDWSPIHEVTVRGSYGTSFRAPTISQIYGNTNSLFVQNYADPTCNCIRQGVARSGSNPGLQPETAQTWSLGVDVEPLPRLKTNVTYWNIHYDNQVTAYLADLSILQREGQFAGTNIIVRDPSAALIAAQLAQTGFTGLLPNPVTLFVDGRNNNLGKSFAQGLDFQASYHLPTAFGTFSTGLNGTYFLNYKVAITAAAPLLDQLNLIFNPLRFRARASFGWNQGPWEADLFVNFENPYSNNLSKPQQRVDSYKPVDLYAAYTVPADHGLLKDLRFGIQVRNLFDEDPPFVNIAESANGGGGYDPTLASPVGRLVSFIIDKKF